MYRMGEIRFLYYKSLKGEGASILNDLGYIYFSCVLQISTLEIFRFTKKRLYM